MASCAASACAPSARPRCVGVLQQPVRKLAFRLLKLGWTQHSNRFRSALDYLGHKNIQHTVRYTEMAPDRFKDFWRD